MISIALAEGNAIPRIGLRDVSDVCPEKVISHDILSMLLPKPSLYQSIQQSVYARGGKAAVDETCRNWLFSATPHSAIFVRLGKATTSGKFIKGLVVIFPRWTGAQ